MFCYRREILCFNSVFIYVIYVYTKLNETLRFSGLNPLNLNATYNASKWINKYLGIYIGEKEDYKGLFIYNRKKYIQIRCYRL